MGTTSLVVDSVPVSGWRPDVLRSTRCLVAFMVGSLEEGWVWFLITSSESVREHNATVGLIHPRTARLTQRSAALSTHLLIDGPRWDRVATCRHGLVAVAKTQVDGTDRVPPGAI